MLLLAGQYGSREALVAAVSSTTALLVLNWPEQSFQQGYYDYLFETLRLPFLWFAAAVLFGEMRVRHVGERSDLRRALNESQTHA